MHSFTCTAAAWRKASIAAAVVVAALLVLTTSVTAEETLADTTSFYGMLELPAHYFSHPDSEAEINRIQPGSVLLHNGHSSIRVPVRRDGGFTVYSLPYGTYLLQADYHDFTFPTVRVEVQYKERVASSEDGGAAGGKARVPIIRSSMNDFPVRPLRGSGTDEQSPAIIVAAGVHSYYIPRAEFRLTDLMKNPMVLMMVVSVGLMGMMKLFPEEEMKESQKMSREWQKKLYKKAISATNGAEEAPTPIEKKRD